MLEVVRRERRKREGLFRVLDLRRRRHPVGCRRFCVSEIGIQELAVSSPVKRHFEVVARRTAGSNETPFAGFYDFDV